MATRVMALPFMVSAIVYALTLCPSVYVEGSGELIGAVSMLGTPHPTGYPLFCLVGRVIVAALPLGNAALEVNIVSALTCSAAVAALSVFLSRRGLHPWIAVGSAFVFAFSATFWSQAVIAEVYGMSSLAAVVTLMAWAWVFDLPQERQLVVAAFATGLAATTHLSQLLLLPGIALLGLRQWRRSAIERAARHDGSALRVALADVRSTGTKLVGAALAGYSVILYLPLRSGRGSGFHWHAIDTPAALWEHVTAAVYRSSFFGMPWEGALINASRFGQQMTSEFPLLCLAPAGWGLWIALRRDRGVAWMAGCAAVANLLTALNYHRDPNGLDVFFLLAILSCVIFLGYGLDDLARRMGRALHSARRGGQAMPGLVATLVVLAVVVDNHRQADRSGFRVAERYGLDILQSLPPSAVLFTEGDDASFILDYLHRVEDVRPDVTLHNRNGLGTAALAPAPTIGDARVRARLLRHAEAELVRTSIAAGRSVFSVFARATPAREFEFVPYGLVYEVAAVSDAVAESERHGVSPHAVSPHAVSPIDMANAASVGEGHVDPWVRKIQANYWYMEGEHRARRGWSQEAMQAYLMAAETADASRTTQYNVSRILLLNNELDEALRHAMRAVTIDPLWPHSYRLAIGILKRLGRAEEARELDRRAAELGRYS